MFSCIIVQETIFQRCRKNSHLFREAENIWVYLGSHNWNSSRRYLGTSIPRGDLPSIYIVWRSMLYFSAPVGLLWCNMHFEHVLEIGNCTACICACTFLLIEFLNTISSGTWSGCFLLLGQSPVFWWLFQGWGRLIETDV